MSTIERIKNIAEECIEVSNEYKGIVNTDYSAIIRERITTLLECDKPRLMVCGVYSAGKSTLVNALCRQEVAEVGAQPMTDKVTEYPYSHMDYILIDSPGVDAPIEHEKITDDFIKKCNSIMFVVSTKNAESEANYRKINEWMRYEKPLIIVVNDKSGSTDPDTPEVQIIREKIEENLRKSGYDRSKKYDVISVNAKMAMQSLKITDETKRAKFLENSHIPMLERLISSHVKDGYATFLAPIGELQRVLDEMESELMSLETNNDNKELFAQLAMIDRESSRINDSINRQIKLACDNGKIQLINVCMSAESQETIDNATKRISENIAATVDKDFKKQVGRLATVVNTSLDKYGISMTSNGIIDIKGTKYDLSDLSSLNSDSEGGGIIGSAISGALLGQMIGTAAGTIVGGGAAAATTAVVSSIIGGGIGAGAGAGAGALSGAALGPIGVIGGAVIGTIIGIATAKSKKREQEAAIQRQIEAENKARQAAADARYKQLQTEIGIMMEQAETEYSKAASEMFSVQIANIKNLINRKISEGNEYNEKIAEARKRISQLKIELESLKNNLR